MRLPSAVRLVLSGMFLALGLLLPFLTGQIPTVGSMLLPMHIPVLLCGFVCGWPYGLAVGFITPLFRYMLFGMPPMPNALAMAFELAVYGFCTGLFYKLLPKKNVFVYVALIISMIFGRIIWGIVSLVIYGLSDKAFTWQMFAAGAVVNAIPGIILQVVIIPPIIIALKRGNLLRNE
ncbi:MAG TPA: ECF transporter S component [Clostridia bacterium]